MKRRQAIKPKMSASTQKMKTVDGTMMLFREYSAVANAFTMTAGRAMLTAVVLSTLMPSREMICFLRHRTPSIRTRNTGSTFWRSMMMSCMFVSFFYFRFFSAFSKASAILFAHSGPTELVSS